MVKGCRFWVRKSGCRPRQYKPNKLKVMMLPGQQPKLYMVARPYIVATQCSIHSSRDTPSKVSKKSISMFPVSIGQFSVYMAHGQHWTVTLSTCPQGFYTLWLFLLILSYPFQPPWWFLFQRPKLWEIHHYAFRSSVISMYSLCIAFQSSPLSKVLHFIIYSGDTVLLFQSSRSLVLLLKCQTQL